MDWAGLTGLLGRFGHGPSVLADHSLDLLTQSLGVGVEHIGAFVGSVGALAKVDVAFDIEPLVHLRIERVKEHVLLVRGELEGDGLGHRGSVRFHESSILQIRWLVGLW